MEMVGTLSHRATQLHTLARTHAEYCVGDMTIPSEAIAADPWRDPHFTLQRTRAWFKSSPCLRTAT